MRQWDGDKKTNTWTGSGWQPMFVSVQVVYFTALFPYVILIALLINNVQLPGALNGIKFFIVPEWGKLLSVEVRRKKVGHQMGRSQMNSSLLLQWWGIIYFIFRLVWMTIDGWCCRSMLILDKHPFILQVWVNAAAQIFNSIGIGFGSLMAMSSYNSFNNNVLK